MASEVDRARALMAANSVFHDQLLAMGRADRIRRQVAGAVDVPLVFQALRHFSQWELARSSLLHHLIAEAISAREPERAARLMTEHVLQGRDALLERLAGRDAVGSDLSTARDAVPGQV